MMRLILTNLLSLTIQVAIVWCTTTSYNSIHLPHVNLPESIFKVQRWSLSKGSIKEDNFLHTLSYSSVSEHRIDFIQFSPSLLLSHAVKSLYSQSQFHLLPFEKWISSATSFFLRTNAQVTASPSPLYAPHRSVKLSKCLYCATTASIQCYLLLWAFAHQKLSFTILNKISYSLQFPPYWNAALYSRLHNLMHSDGFCEQWEQWCWWLQQ